MFPFWEDVIAPVIEATNRPAVAVAIDRRFIAFVMIIFPG